MKKLYKNAVYAILLNIAASPYMSIAAEPKTFDNMDLCMTYIGKEGYSCCCVPGGSWCPADYELSGETCSKAEDASDSTGYRERYYRTTSTRGESPDYVVMGETASDCNKGVSFGGPSGVYDTCLWNPDIKQHSIQYFYYYWTYQGTQITGEYKTGDYNYPTDIPDSIDMSAYLSCKPGYYLKNERCYKCPTSGGVAGTTVDKNTGDITSCYIPAGTEFHDDIGTYTHTADCHYKK